MPDVESETIILQGTFAARPAAADALEYYVTTGASAGKRYWSDGAMWFEQPPTVETHVHAGTDITSGTVADARIDAAIARDSEVTSAVSAHVAAGDPHTGYQLESGLAAAITGTKLDDLTAPDDNTDLNATTSAHGLLPKLGGGSTNFLRADGTWNAPAGGSGDVATDAIWDAAGDLAVGTGANTAARLVPGTSAQVLHGGTAPAWTAVLPADLDVSADNTTADATTGHHGLLPKLGGGSTNFLRADGSWAAPGGGSALAHGFATVATDEGSTNGAFVALTTAGPVVTITVNTKVKVTLSADNYGSAAGTGCRMGVVLSGANTLAADDARSLCYVSYDNSNNNQQASRVLYLTGLTPGSTVFTSVYKRMVTGTAHWRFREILVECMD